METLTKLMDISSRIDHLEHAAQWITLETVNNDPGLSQTGTLISVLAEEIREKLFELVKELESVTTFQIYPQ
jgi:hypothetical protein